MAWCPGYCQKMCCSFKLDNIHACTITIFERSKEVQDDLELNLSYKHGKENPTKAQTTKVKESVEERNKSARGDSQTFSAKYKPKSLHKYIRVLNALKTSVLLSVQGYHEQLIVQKPMKRHEDVIKALKGCYQVYRKYRCYKNLQRKNKKEEDSPGNQEQRNYHPFRKGFEKIHLYPPLTSQSSKAWSFLSLQIHHVITQELLNHKKKGVANKGINEASTRTTFLMCVDVGKHTLELTFQPEVSINHI